jgi:hypothetical protein
MDGQDAAIEGIWTLDTDWAEWLLNLPTKWENSTVADLTWSSVFGIGAAVEAYLNEGLGNFQTKWLLHCTQQPGAQKSWSCSVIPQGGQGLD